ncbi:MAG TPA: pro-sigmaK processing inhibitor BofA family protein [Methanothrix sp.]|nr:pro-sigmaK processing inhibitor BofA family protein [Methanothrix sp.]HOK59187.1 pro-sigmaK processing inhibitor BofA family protein [Methanothrix sp.]HOL44642.1 pro-sigmaK processing inhibitor BofA family protein [Methanothrix sp.]HPO89423.1 pro-sigmaK processing inhibitor BofA family protein [Methanothrix sp.]
MIELGMLLLLIAVLIGLIVILKSLRTFVVNAVIGLFVLYLANAAAGLGIGYDWSVVLICAFGGALGALMVIALHIMGWAF